MRRLAFSPELLLGATVLALAACETDRSISTSPAGPPAYGVSLALTPTNLPRGTVTFRFNTIASPADDSIEITLQGLDTLENGFYTIWFGDTAATRLTRASGTLRVVRTDSSTNDQGDLVVTRDSVNYPGTAAFSNGGARSTLRFFTSRTTSGMPVADSLQLVLITIEDNASATVPNASRRPLWATRPAGGSPPTQTRTANFIFGNFDPTVGSRYVYVPEGRGRAYVRGSTFIVNDTNLTRPPLGYYYAVYAERQDSATNVPTDTLFLGELASAADRSISLRNADSLVVDSRVQLVSPPSILAASNRVDASEVGLPSTRSFRDFARVLVTLESKNSDNTRMGPAILLRADLPGIVRFPKP